MKILHLYSNHKWTGPAALALECVRGLMDRGADVEFAIAGFVHDGMQHAIRAHADALGLRMRDGLELRRHFHLRSFHQDAATLAAWIDQGTVDVIHCHQPGDHLVAGLAAGRAKRPVRVVRSLWDGRAPRRSLRTALAFRRTHALTVPVPCDRETAMARRFGVDPQLVRVVPGPLAAEFFAARDAAHAVSNSRQDAKRAIGIEASRRVVGITARIQEKRRWNLLWDLVARMPHEVGFAVLGRPDEGVFERLCAEPLRRLGIEDRVSFLGYRSGEDYITALRAFDAFVFLVPGSDATCRALREAMTLGTPVVTTDLGLLPHIVDDGTTGLVRPPDAGHLAAALYSVLDERVGAALGNAAREHALATWTRDHAASRLGELYDRLVGTER
ncbi:MAG: glycosyltransferase family 4 protein [Planctomycetes bacterium]|nr:glycosyltransferase family 4 protein [Planctomycetota bacterium]MCB9916907.1 glycosyltransferase family 4 protein [Planctomycetota bacterium]